MCGPYRSCDPFFIEKSLETHTWGFLSWDNGFAGADMCFQSIQTILVHAKLQATGVISKFNRDIIIVINVNAIITEMNSKVARFNYHFLLGVPQEIYSFLLCC